MGVEVAAAHRTVEGTRRTSRHDDQTPGGARARKCTKTFPETAIGASTGVGGTGRGACKAGKAGAGSTPLAAVASDQHVGQSWR